MNVETHAPLESDIQRADYGPTAPQRRRVAGGRFRGFTFFELLLVLAIFIVIASLATPFLLRTFNSQALKSGSDLVRSDI